MNGSINSIHNALKLLQIIIINEDLNYKTSVHT